MSILEERDLRLRPAEAADAMPVVEKPETLAGRTETPPHPVLFVLPNFAGGGAERVALILLANLDRRRFAPSLAVFEAAGPLRDMVPKDVPVHDLRQPRLRKAFPALIGLIRKTRPSAVFATQGYVNLGLLLARPVLPRRVRIVVRESNTPSQSLPNRRHARLKAMAYRFLYPTADTVFCQHRKTEQEMSTRFHVPVDRIQRFPNPVDVARLRSAAGQPRREPGPGLRFVAAGRLNRQKGFDRLLDMMSGLPSDSRATIFGEGPDEDALRAKAADLGLGGRVRFAGFTDNLAQWLAGADACLIPSRWEGLPNVALEALSCGTPVIATPESGGIAELAAEASPGVVTLADIGDAFAAAMLAVPTRQDSGLRPCLLPGCYELNESIAFFADTLERLCTR